MSLRQVVYDGLEAESDRSAEIQVRRFRTYRWLLG